MLIKLVNNVDNKMKILKILTFEIVDSVNKILHDKDTNFLIKKY